LPSNGALVAETGPDERSSSRTSRRVAVALAILGERADAGAAIARTRRVSGRSRWLTRGEREERRAATLAVARRAANARPRPS
jgi:hypothetical protein